MGGVSDETDKMHLNHETPLLTAGYTQFDYLHCTEHAKV